MEGLLLVRRQVGVAPLYGRLGHPRAGFVGAGGLSRIDIRHVVEDVLSTQLSVARPASHITVVVVSARHGGPASRFLVGSFEVHVVHSTLSHYLVWTEWLAWIARLHLNLL